MKASRPALIKARDPHLAGGKRALRAGQVDVQKRAKLDAHFVRACAVETHMEISKGKFCASRRRQKLEATASTLT